MMVLIAAMVASVGLVLAQAPDPPQGRGYGFGQLRDYADRPDTAWTRGIDDLPGFSSSGGPVTVADTHGSTWLLAYPSGLGRAFLAVNRFDGTSRWDKPIVAGLGSCAFDSGAHVGCAVKVGDVPDGFYLVDPGSGALGPPQPLEDTGRMIGAGKDFIRVNQVGYRVSATSPGGTTTWSRTFADSATPAYLPEADLVDVKLADASHILLDPHTGATRLSCTTCTVTAYPTGLAVSQAGDSGVVDFYAFSAGKLVTKPTHTSRSMQVSAGPATLAVVGGTGLATVSETHGRFEIRDPAKPKGLWSVADDSLSKGRPMACGRLVAFGRKDATRVVMRLDGKGTVVGHLPAPDRQRPDTSIAELRCVGSFGDLLVVANDNQITAFDTAAGRIRWEVPVNGTAQNVDGHLVLRQGATISLLR
ncbi:hypothetical protein GCM10010528_08790 [Gordonia defluvii]|uniref:Pyrroloquinoline-quinone binding quinoprotein n=1 Tax=Gordonia defluvii TaxID=283718 RepID=A0ABP6L196_9ACTN